MKFHLPGRAKSAGGARFTTAETAGGLIITESLIFTCPGNMTPTIWSSQVLFVTHLDMVSARDLCLVAKQLSCLSM